MAIYKSKAVTKDGRKWFFSVCYLTANGEKIRYKSKKFLTKQEAQDAERIFLTNDTSSKVNITFEEMYYQYLDYTDEYIKGSTKYCKNNRIKKHIMPYFGKMNIHDITVNTVMIWKSKISNETYGNEKKYALQYKQTLMIELKAALKYGMDFCGLKENVACKVNNFQDKNETVVSDEEKVRYIKPDEFNLFISVINDILWKTFFSFLYYTGCRKGEVQALYWNDIDFENKTVRIIKTITNKTEELNKSGYHFKITNTKNRKNRTIKIPIILKNMLLALHEYYMNFEGFCENWYVFGGYRHLASRTIDTEKDYYFDLANKTYGKMINRITNHEFRHSHASYLISKGVKAELIAYRLGDTIGVVLETYAHLFPEVEDSIIEKLDLIETTKKEFLKSQSA